MKVLHLFSGYNTLTDIMRYRGYEVITLDNCNYPGHTKQTHLIDFLDFNYKVYNAAHFDFIFIGFPCNTFSKASGGFHFIDNAIPITKQAHISLNMIDKMHELLSYFSSSLYVIENPVSALFKNEYFIKRFDMPGTHLYRFHQGSFGHQVHKQTDFFTNINIPFFSPVMYRVNGKYNANKLDNLGYKKRVSYPYALCHTICDYIELAIKH